MTADPAVQEAVARALLDHGCSHPDAIIAALEASGIRLVKEGLERGGLDEAWRAVEEALPEGWWLSVHGRSDVLCSAYARDGRGRLMKDADGEGDGPEAALRALAARLAEQEPQP